MSRRVKVLVGIAAACVLLAMVVAGVRATDYISRRSSTDRRLTAIADYLVDCTTPTPTTVPNDDGPRVHVHECFETGQRGQSGAIAEIDCRARRMQARLPAPPDPALPCIKQTPADVFPGVAGQPTRSNP